MEAVEVSADSGSSAEAVGDSSAQSWGGYTWSLMRRLGQGTMAVIDYLGEKIAYGLGITTPDWQYAIDIYEDMEREEREEREAEERALQEQQRIIAQRYKELEEARDLLKQQQQQQPSTISNSQLS